MNQAERINAWAGDDFAGGGDNRFQLLQEGQKVHRELRVGLPKQYVQFVEGMLRGGTGLTRLFDRGQVRGLAVWHCFTTTCCGIRFEIDDLVTAAQERSRGYGYT